VFNDTADMAILVPIVSCKQWNNFILLTLNSTSLSHDDLPSKMFKRHLCCMPSIVSEVCLYLICTVFRVLADSSFQVIRFIILN
jgi:hypothetical protein